jgi:hypothetical protein
MVFSSPSKERKRERKPRDTNGKYIRETVLCTTPATNCSDVTQSIYTKANQKKVLNRLTTTIRPQTRRY